MFGQTNPGRRAFLKASAFSAVAMAPAIATARAASQANPADDNFTYQIVRTKAEWKARLSPEEYEILRRNGTERPDSSPLAKAMGEGGYACRGCDLALFQSPWKVVLDAGYVFFGQSNANALLTSVDNGAPYGSPDAAKDPAKGPIALIEVHCRRCGSHMGHLLRMDKKLLYCINGASLHFTPAAA